MDAHKRIWAWPHFDGWITGDWSANTYHDDRTVEYILATEHDRIVAEKDAEIARLRNDCRILLAQIAWLEECTGEGLEGEDAALVAEIAATVGDDNG